MAEERFLSVVMPVFNERRTVMKVIEKVRIINIPVSRNDFRKTGTGNFHAPMPVLPI